MELWYPGAVRHVLEDAGPFVSNLPWRGILHTTEGSSTSGAIGAYVANRSSPHFTFNLDSPIVVTQHIPLNRAARALQNLPGGVETNRVPCIQIEFVGHARNGIRYSEEFRKLLTWIEQQTGIKADYPTKSQPKFSYDQWNRYGGWCGHIHVPENNHTDPGMVDQTLFIRKQMADVTDTIILKTPSMVRHEVFVPRLDEGGNGYVDLKIPFDRLVSTLEQGPAPDRDGYGWPDYELRVNNTGGVPRVAITGGPKLGALTFWYWEAVGFVS